MWFIVQVSARNCIPPVLFFSGRKELLLWTWCIIILRHKRLCIHFENLVTDFQNWRTPEHNALSHFFPLHGQIPRRKTGLPHMRRNLHSALQYFTFFTVMTGFLSTNPIFKSLHGKHVSSSVKTRSLLWASNWVYSKYMVVLDFKVLHYLKKSVLQLKELHFQAYIFFLYI